MVRAAPDSGLKVPDWQANRLPPHEAGGGRRRIMDVRQLELFLAVMESSGVTRAAEKVYLSPGAVSVQIHSLADELKTDLFVRSGKRIVPTPQAFRLAEHARGVLAKMRAIEQEFANDPAKDERPFHFASGATTLIHRLGVPLRLLRRACPVWVHFHARLVFRVTDRIVLLRVRPTAPSRRPFDPPSPGYFL